MKKLLILSAMCMAMTAQATVLRVSNITNSGAPYADITSALAAAAEGDTIMVDGSSTSYGDLTVDKKIVLMGPGYLRTENGVLTEGSNSAQISALTISADGTAGTVVQGMDITGITLIETPNVVITRCRIRGSFRLTSAATNTVIHQNYFTNGSHINYGNSNSDNDYKSIGTQITNNIFNTSAGANSTPIFRYITDGYIAYNTFTYPDRTLYQSLTSCTVEYNVCVGNEINITGCTIQNNYWPGMKNSSGVSLYEDRTTDLTIKNQQLSEEIAAAIADKGAFNGDDPYVISGIPAGPVIQDITVPASVAQGSTLNVTIKLGVQR
jgi:hypothetical protein